MIQILPEKKKECCGCSACFQICPQKCISMIEDSEGFVYPEVDRERCIGCGLCEKTCPIIEKKKHDKHNVNSQNSDRQDSGNNIKAVGGWHKDDNIRYESSSGGAFTLFAEYVIKHGGVVYGCTLDENMQAKHIGIDCMEDLIRLKGSKYVQSDINNVYSEIKDCLSAGRMALFVGTPCQCAGLKSFLECAGKDANGVKNIDKLYTCDFICHGVPSPKVFRSYIKFLEEKYHDKVTSFRFRNKDKGWSSTGLQMGTDIGFKDIGSKRLAPAFRDAYMNGFLDDVYLRPSCYDCEFKSLPKYYSDITIADFWGVKKVDAELNGKKGTSLILLNSKHGERLFDEVKNNFFYKEVDFEAAVRKNKSLLRSADENPNRNKFFNDYETMPFDKVKKKYMGAFTWAYHKVMKNAKLKNLIQFIKFAIVGASNTIVSYTINVTMLFLLRGAGLTYDYVIANLTAFALSVLWSFHWNSRYVFDPDRNEKGWRLKTLTKTYISYALTGIFLNNILSTLWIQVLGVSKYLAPLLNMPFSIPTNFLMHKFWAYRNKRQKVYK